MVMYVYVSIIKLKHIQTHPVGENHPFLEMKYVKLVINQLAGNNT